MLSFIARRNVDDMAGPDALDNLHGTMSTIAQMHKRELKSFTLKTTTPHTLMILDPKDADIKEAVMLMIDADKNQV